MHAITLYIYTQACLRCIHCRAQKFISFHPYMGRKKSYAFEWLVRFVCDPSLFLFALRCIVYAKNGNVIKCWEKVFDEKKNQRQQERAAVPTSDMGPWTVMGHGNVYVNMWRWTIIHPILSLTFLHYQIYVNTHFMLPRNEYGHWTRIFIGKYRNWSNSIYECFQLSVLSIKSRFHQIKYLLNESITKYHYFHHIS